MKKIGILIFILFLCLLPSRFLFADSETIEINATVVSLCGNGVVNTGEQCDSTDLAGQTCVGQGFVSGVLSCTASCAFNTASCNSGSSSASSAGGGGGGGGGGGFQNLINLLLPANTSDAGGLKLAKSDINSDHKVNLVDFSIAAYWYKRSSPPESVDLNGDKIINLVDFSIMAFYWTG